MGQNRQKSFEPLGFRTVRPRASIFIVTLWSLIFLSILAVMVSSAVRQKLVLLKRIEEIDKLRYVAEAGAYRGIMEVMRQKPSESACALKDTTWSINPGAFQKISVGDGFCEVSNTTFDSNGAPVTRYGLVDEERKININTADMVVLKRLFQGLGFEEVQSQELAASIIDWRDEDGELLIPLGSAEESYYSFLKYSYHCKNAEFQTLEELLLVRGVTQDVFEKIKNYVTIYGSGKININTASRAVLLAIGLNEMNTDRVLKFRVGEDTQEATADDIIFDEPSHIVPWLSQAYRLSSSEVAQLSNAVDLYATTRSEAFMIQAHARGASAQSHASTVCVVNQAGTIFYWREI